MQSTGPPEHTESSTGSTIPHVERSEAPKQDAFKLLLSSQKPSQLPQKPAHSNRANSKNSLGWLDPRNGLGEYLSAPKHPLLIYENDFGVAIYDKYPKGFIHTLFIPRDTTRMFLHPFDAFADQLFLQNTKRHVAELKRIVAAEVRNSLGKYSEKEKPRRLAMEMADAPSAPGLEELPSGRDWESELLVGVHAGPSMNHLHVHVLTPDHVSDCMRQRKHYNSFATPFLVQLDEFPLPEDDRRRDKDRGGWLRSDLTCWRCNMNFKNRLSELKVHLKREFDEWIKI